LHRRSVLLDRASRCIDIVDEIEGGQHDLRLAFHLGPEVEVELTGSYAALGWPAACTHGARLAGCTHGARPAGCTHGAARLELPAGLEWTLHRGGTDPILGWYSGGLGQRVPAFALIGCGRSVPGVPLITRLEFSDIAKAELPAMSRSTAARHFSELLMGEAPAMYEDTR
jgi:hypothetical protein